MKQINTKNELVYNQNNMLNVQHLLKLHDDLEDSSSLKKWIRITSKSNEDLLYSKLLNCIEQIKHNKNMTDWHQFREFLSEKLKINLDITTLYGLRGGKFNGKRRGIPIRILDCVIKEYCLCNNGNYESLWNEFYIIIDYVVICGGKEIKIIKEIGEDLCYIVGMIIADGTCPDASSRKNKEYRDYKILIGKDDEKFIRKIAYMLLNSTGIRARVFKDIYSGPTMWALSFKSKYMFRLLNKIFEIPIGKKSERVLMPQIIKYSNKENVFSFIRGVMDGDGCIYIYNHTTKKPYGIYRYSRLKIVFRVRSTRLVSDIANVLKSYGYPVKEFSYIGNGFKVKSKVKFYGFYLISKNAERYAKEVGFLNPQKIEKANEFFEALNSLQHWD